MSCLAKVSQELCYPIGKAWRCKTCNALSSRIKRLRDADAVIGALDLSTMSPTETAALFKQCATLKGDALSKVGDVAQ